MEDLCNAEWLRWSWNRGGHCVDSGLWIKERTKRRGLTFRSFLFQHFLSTPIKSYSACNTLKMECFLGLFLEFHFLRGSPKIK
jgi:hypothetical protein